MPNEKKPVNNNQQKHNKERNLNESAGHQGSRNFSKVEKSKNSSDSGKIEYISKPKISSQDTNNDKKK